MALNLSHFTSVSNCARRETARAFALENHHEEAQGFQEGREGLLMPAVKQDTNAPLADPMDGTPSVDEMRRMRAFELALEAFRNRPLDDVFEGARKIEAYLKG